MARKKHVSRKVEVSSLYTPTERHFGSVEDICLQGCPYPEKVCKGDCDFYKQEYRKLIEETRRSNNGRKQG